MNNRGQVMLLTIMVLSGTILGATTIAGFLTLYQIRQSTDIINSTKAIFAADAGLECEFYKYTRDKASDFCSGAIQNLTNGASFLTERTDTTVGTTTITTIKSNGTAGDAVRAFEASF
jgi:hypothetical protein